MNEFIMPGADGKFRLLTRKTTAASFIKVGHRVLAIELKEFSVVLYDIYLTNDNAAGLASSRLIRHITNKSKKQQFNSDKEFNQYYAKLVADIKNNLREAPLADGDFEPVSKFNGQLRSRKNFVIKTLTTENIETGDICVWVSSKATGVWELILDSVNGVTMKNGLTEKAAMRAAGYMMDFTCRLVPAEPKNSHMCVYRRRRILKAKAAKKRA